MATLSRGNVPAGRAGTPADRNSHRAPACLLRVQLSKSRTLTRVTGYRILGGALLAWSLLLISGQFEGLWARRLVAMDRYLGPLPQMLIGMAMVVVLYEQERRTVQENSLFFSTLDVDNSRLVSATDVIGGFEKILRRIMSLVRVQRAAIFVGDEWRSALPNVAVGFSQEFAHDLHAQGLTEYLINMAYRRGGVVTLRNLPHLSEPLPPGAPGALRQVANAAGRIRNPQP